MLQLRRQVNSVLLSVKPTINLPSEEQNYILFEAESDYCYAAVFEQVKLIYPLSMYYVLDG